MAIGVLHDIPGGTRADYEAITQAMGRSAGLSSLSDWPAEGILCHIAGPYDGGWRVVDVWESEEAFGRFAETLMPAIQQAGVEGGAPQFFQIHNLVKD
jgi:hypothetical protein